MSLGCNYFTAERESSQCWWAVFDRLYEPASCPPTL